MKKLNLVFMLTLIFCVTNYSVYALSYESFGKTDVGTNSQIQIGWKYACCYKPANNGTLISIHIYTEPTNATLIKAALYDRVAMAPENLLIESSSQAIVTGWNVIPLSFNLTASTYYYLTWKTNGYSSWHWDYGGETKQTYVSEEAWNGFSDPFGGGTSGALEISVYGTYSKEENTLMWILARRIPLLFFSMIVVGAIAFVVWRKKTL